MKFYQGAALLILSLLNYNAIAANTNMLTTPDINPHVVGGTPIHISQAPYQVALINNSNRQFCGGTLIAKNWVVTAAHCLWGISPGRVTVVAGQTKQSEFTRGIDVSEIYKYPGFYDTKSGKDIALLKLAQNVDLSNPNIRAIRYATANDVASGTLDPGILGTLTGWGKSNITGGSIDHLQMVNMHLVSLEDALDAFSRHYGIHRLTPDQLPAWEPNKSACHGDSGGPLVVRDGSDLILAGVVSWGKNCDDLAPSMFARVSSFENWIRGIAGPIDHDFPPQVTILQPGNNSQFIFGSEINVVANVEARSYAGIAQVKFYTNGNEQAVLYRPPYKFDWQNAPLGEHTIKVTATDDSGKSTSAFVTVSVIEQTNNIPPTVRFISPSAGDEFEQGQEITILSEALDPDGTITEVNFFANEVLLGTDLQAPYIFVWRDVPKGQKILKVQAIDNEGAKSISQIMIKVNEKNTGGQCQGVPVWERNKVYARANSFVTYLNNKYRNSWWTQGEVPTESGQWGVWKFVESCD